MFILLTVTCTKSFSQHNDTVHPVKKWFITLPLRFTQLQNHNTMLSGVKLGRVLAPGLQVSLSIYHSFYLKSFKAQAMIPAFDPRPRVFINAMGIEFEYYLIQRKKVSLTAQCLLGWGFMKYDLQGKNFKSKQVNYFALEPALVIGYNINTNTSIGLGAGYRPLLTNGHIIYSSNLQNGSIPLDKKLPNGINILLNLNGRF